MTTILPLSDKIAVTRIEQVKQTAAGIFIPETNLEKPDQGLVIAVGPGKMGKDGVLIPPVVAVGDTVIFIRNSYQVVKIDGEEILMMCEADLLGIIR